MENSNSVIIKKKSTTTMIAAVLEVLVGISFIFTQGPKSFLVCFMFFVAAITAISGYDEMTESLHLKQNKLEIYKRKDLLESIRYDSIISLSYENGEDIKNKKKKFIKVKYKVKKKKCNAEKNEKYFIETSHFTKKELRQIVEKMKNGNNDIKIYDNLKDYLESK